MDAKLLRVGVLALATTLAAQVAHGATVASTNFVVTAESPELAQKVAKCAEFWRQELANRWLGRELRNWYKPCPIHVKAGRIGAGGSTTFSFANGEVFGWKMEVQGTPERILDSVIPHEVNHTIFASYFRRPLPRWADEGAATLFEHRSERMRQVETFQRALKTDQRIPLENLLNMREYPKDYHQVLTLYAEGYALAEYLIGQKGEDGRQVYLKFLHDAHRHGWDRAIKHHYGYEGVKDLESQWTDWFIAGMPAFTVPEGQMLAANDASDSNSDDLVIRSQSPEQQNRVDAPAYASRESAQPSSQPKQLQPLPTINRELRAGRLESAPPESRTRTTETSYIQTSSRTRNVEAFRSRTEAQLMSGPSLLPARLGPSANGIFDADQQKKECFSFPQRRVAN